MTINSGASNDLVEKHSLGISIKSINVNNIKNDLNINLKKFNNKKNFYKDNCFKFYTQNFNVKNVIKQYLDAI